MPPLSLSLSLPEPLDEPEPLPEDEPLPEPLLLSLDCVEECFLFFLVIICDSKYAEGWIEETYEICKSNTLWDNIIVNNNGKNSRELWIDT